MPQEPLKFLSNINTLCMEMTTKFRIKDGRKHRNKVLRKMKALSRRIAILIRDFMGTKPRAKGIENRQMMVGWVVLSHNLGVLARQP